MEEKPEDVSASGAAALVQRLLGCKLPEMDSLHPEGTRGYAQACPGREIAASRTVQWGPARRDNC